MEKCLNIILSFRDITNNYNFGYILCCLSSRCFSHWLPRHSISLDWPPDLLLSLVCNLLEPLTKRTRLLWRAVKSNNLLQFLGWALSDFFSYSLVQGGRYLPCTVQLSSKVAHFWSCLPLPQYLIWLEYHKAGHDWIWSA